MNNNNKGIQFLVSSILFLLCFCIDNTAISQVVTYTTTANGDLKFRQEIISPTSHAISSNFLTVNASKRYQKMEGFGYAFTGGSAQLIAALPLEKRNALMTEIFGNQSNHLGLSYLRVSMGASDLDAAVFSYCDLKPGQTDTALQHFSLAQDTNYLIPLLQQAIKINPTLKVMASPWSPPVWMKTNGASIGGHLLPQYYKTYARYFVKYIQAMKAKGISIASVTIQNEPEHGGNNPSMLMNAQEQTVFVRDYLGPQLKAAKLATEIVIWDHNADHPEYPISVLNDAKAKSFIAASAFHLYLGNESALSKVHQLHPDKKIYFTEQWTGAKGEFAGDLMWHLEHIVMGTIQNWSSLVLEWNLAADAQYAPHTQGGCTECKGAFTIQGEMVQRNVSYYIIGQIAQFVPAGSIRIAAATNNDNLKTIAFLTPSGKKVALVLNTGNADQNLSMTAVKKYNFSIPKQSAITIVW
jgi:glucosylceramidase